MSGQLILMAVSLGFLRPRPVEIFRLPKCSERERERGRDQLPVDFRVQLIVHWKNVFTTLFIWFITFTKEILKFQFKIDYWGRSTAPSICIPSVIYISCHFSLFRLYDPAGLHRATPAPVSALPSAGCPAEVGVPPASSSGQWHSRSSSQLDQW